MKVLTMTTVRFQLLYGKSPHYILWHYIFIYHFVELSDKIVISYHMYYITKSKITKACS